MDEWFCLLGVAYHQQLATFLANAESHLPDQPIKIRKQRSNKNKKQKQPDGNSESEDKDSDKEWAAVTKVKKAKTQTTSTKPANKKPRHNMKVARQLPRSKLVIDTSDEEDDEGHWGLGMGTNP